jgi:hypothetical protein
VSARNLDLFLSIAPALAQAVLATVPGAEKIAPVIPSVVNGILLAEKFPHATGPEKKSVVLGIAGEAIESLNLGGAHIDAQDALMATSAGIDAVIAAIKVVQQAHAVHAAAHGVV